MCTSTIKKERAEFIAAYINNNNEVLIDMAHKLKGCTCMFYCANFDELMTEVNTKLNKSTLSELDYTLFIEELNSFICCVANKINQY